MLIPSANELFDFFLKNKIKWKKQKKKQNPSGSNQVLLINPKNGQGELTTPEIKTPNFELTYKFPRISSST